jgi:hypothetical protein
MVSVYPNPNVKVKECLLNGVTENVFVETASSGLVQMPVLAIVKMTYQQAQIDQSNWLVQTSVLRKLSVIQLSSSFSTMMIWNVDVNSEESGLTLMKLASQFVMIQLLVLCTMSCHQLTPDVLCHAQIMEQA